tara:strand:- start:765 stop:1166 length:402 start_codon:yes stop_codon:yes gene_type:complete
LKQKNIKLGIVKVILLFIIFNIFTNLSSAEDKNLEGKNVQLKILDKVSSKNTTIDIEIGKEKQFQNLLIKAMKCKNSEFDDNPEITAYIQVKDITQNNNDKVFVFNGWTFSSSPSLQPFDHPVYDIWLTKCYS